MRRTARSCSAATPTSAARYARWRRCRTRDEYDAWATGLRRQETHNRVIAPVIGWDEAKRKVKVSPLARWTDDEVDRYIVENGVLVNPLQYDGYPSIGCFPCTRRVAPGEDPRSGRWAGSSKTECGIHA
jgi:phosphoadenosine phosphosulfate reductase